MLKILLVGLLQVALGLGNGPTMAWKQSVEPADGADWTLVLEGRIADGFFVHPMEDKAIGVTLEIEPAPGLLLVGEPEEEFSPSDYKGETVATGTYVLRQKFNYTGSRPLTLKGEVGWSACEGDACRQPEYLEFKCPVATGDGAEAGTGGESLWALLLEAILWGFLMLLTPCVFPMVPMTVSFFLKGSGNAAAGRFKALMYGLFIVLLYTVPISIIIGLTWVLGGSAVTADIFNWLSTHWIPNILFFLVFMAFAASFFGAFEIVLPARWTNSADKNSDRAGLAGVFFLALTLVLVSFSCTGPIVGTVLIKSTQGEFWTPMLAMLAFSVAFALPFTLLAFFPSLLKKLPKSGGWLNSVKVVLGFIEIALGLKFLSTADQTYHWHILDREVYLAIWIVCFTLLGLYLLGKLRFKHDEPLPYISVGRLALAIIDLAFVVYLIPGMWGAPLKALSGYMPPLETQDFVLTRTQAAAVPAAQLPAGAGVRELPHGLQGYERLEDALAAAKAQGKKVFVDFTGYGCVNCREMEARVWSDPEVLRLLREDYVIASLYVDDKTKLPESAWVTTAGGKVLKDIGRVNSYIATEQFGVNSQPNYFLLDADGNRLAGPRAYNLDIPGFIEFLQP
ncbi:MAG: thioredoxin family protein [Bacteroidales bacterium]|nr:thioredoxin family protein [Bacteroidales bacterium]